MWGGSPEPPWRVGAKQFNLFKHCLYGIVAFSRSGDPLHIYIFRIQQKNTQHWATHRQSTCAFDICSALIRNSLNALIWIGTFIFAELLSPAVDEYFENPSRGKL
jgi:hypothetical protein